VTRVVVDANVVVSGIIARPTSPPALILNAVREGALEAVACPRLSVEIRDALGSPYFQARVSEHEATLAVAAFESVAVMLADPVAAPRVVRDPTDDYLVALAQVSGASAIITGDNDLLDHAGLQPPSIDSRTACANFGLRR